MKHEKLVQCLDQLEDALTRVATTKKTDWLDVKIALEALYLIYREKLNEAPRGHNENSR